MKVVSLLKRGVGISLDMFHRKILEHAQLRVPPQGCTRFVQSHTLSRGYRKGELPSDAVEEWWFDDVEDARIAMLAARQANRSDLIDAAQSHVLLVHPHVVKVGAVSRGTVKNIEFVIRRPGMDSEPFFKYWCEVHGPLGSTIPTILRYEQNHSVEGDPIAQRQFYDGLAITWFESTATMRSGAETDAYRLTRADEANFLPDGHLPAIITAEVLDTGWM